MLHTSESFQLRELTPKNVEEFCQKLENLKDLDVSQRNAYVDDNVWDLIGIKLMSLGDVPWDSYKKWSNERLFKALREVYPPDGTLLIGEEPEDRLRRLKLQVDEQNPHSIDKYISAILAEDKRIGKRTPEREKLLVDILIEGIGKASKLNAAVKNHILTGIRPVKIKEYCAKLQTVVNQVAASVRLLCDTGTLVLKPNGKSAEDEKSSFHLTGSERRY